MFWWGTRQLLPWSGCRRLRCHPARFCTHAFDELGSISPAALYYPSSAFEILPIYMICYSAGAAQVCAEETGGFIFKHRFCTAAQWEVSLYVIKNLVADFSARQWVLWLLEFMVSALHNFDQSFNGRSHLVDTVVGDLVREWKYQCFHSSQYLVDVGLFTQVTTVSIHPSTFFQLDPFIPIRIWVLSQLPPSFSKQIDYSAGRRSATLPVLQSSMQAVQCRRIDVSPGARSQDICYGKDPAVSLSNPCLSHCFFEPTFLSMTPSFPCLAYVIYLVVMNTEWHTNQNHRPSACNSMLWSCTKNVDE